MKAYKVISYVILFVLVLFTPFGAFAAISGKAETDNGNNALVSIPTDKIEAFVQKQMKDGKIPGMSVVIVKGDETVYIKGFGYADLKAGRRVTRDTLFELGSNSKAFTALGILRLEEKGLIRLSDPVKKYLPWFKMQYEGEYRGRKINGAVDITLEQLLHHTSGIPFKTIGDIPAADGDEALRQTIKALTGKKLDFYPGERFLYATINYDILGLVIQQVSGQTFEAFMKSNVLRPLGLDSTFLFRQEAALHDMSVGYKIGFLRPDKYNAPMFRGNTPAGYFITSAKDMAKWLKIQLGTGKTIQIDPHLIERSHVPDRSVNPGPGGSSYAGGWQVYQNGGGEISHGGNNPNFSSFIVYRPEEKLGVAVLANINSAYTQAAGQGVMDMIQGKTTAAITSDMYKSVDNVSVCIICMALPFSCIILWFLTTSFIQLFKRKRRLEGNGVGNILRVVLSVLFLTGFGYCLYVIPEVLYQGLPWSFVKVWAPQSLIIAVASLFTAVFIFCCYLTFTAIFPRHGEKDMFSVIILSIASGFGNSIIIFVINEALNRTYKFQGGLLMFCVMGIVIYVYGQRAVRARLITITNNLVYEKRMELVNRVLAASCRKMDEMENGKIHAGLNNDTEMVSNFANIIITGGTSLITLICCFIYLGIINLYGLLISLVVICIGAGLYYIVGRSAGRIWEQTRDIQNVFFKFINDLLSGFKELSIHNGRQREFKRDMQESCDTYREKRIRAELKFANVIVVGELLFTLVIGAVAFIFPVIFKGIQDSTLRNYVFVFLYMTGPVRAILSAIPQILQVKISWNRINQLIGEMAVDEKDKKESRDGVCDNKVLSLELKDVAFSYKGQGKEEFSIGPINYGFRPGEISFITGGNGSGKSTLAKLITGLYEPDAGEIRLNGCRISSRELAQHYSVVFNDFHLFDKLYGIDYENKKVEIEKYLKILHIDDKLQVEKGVFSTIRLSTGQRKRLALLISYLEDRDVYLFDEWAADQDPEFRRFFYYTLLPELKNRGKCVIAITHDDRYFNTADRVIKMEMGRIVMEEGTEAG